MKLTKLQRHTLYIIMHYELKNNSISFFLFKTPYKGFCHVLSEITIDHFWKGVELNDLPELKAKRPAITYGAFWYKMYKHRQRLAILEQCINETYE